MIYQPSVPAITVFVAGDNDAGQYKVQPGSNGSYTVTGPDIAPMYFKEGAAQALSSAVSSAKPSLTSIGRNDKGEYATFGLPITPSTISQNGGNQQDRPTNSSTTPSSWVALIPMEMKDGRIYASQGDDWSHQWLNAGLINGQNIIEFVPDDRMQKSIHGNNTDDFGNLVSQVMTMIGASKVVLALWDSSHNKITISSYVNVSDQDTDQDDLTMGKMPTQPSSANQINSNPTPQSFTSSGFILSGSSANEREPNLSLPGNASEPTYEDTAQPSQMLSHPVLSVHTQDALANNMETAKSSAIDTIKSMAGS